MGRSDWMASHGPVRGRARHERKARGLSIGALRGAWHHAACAAHVDAGEARTSAASSTPAPARWQEPLTDRIGRPDQAGAWRSRAGNDRDASEAGLQRSQGSGEGFAGTMPTGSAVSVDRRLRRGKGAGAGVDDRHAQMCAFVGPVTWRNRSTSSAMTEAMVKLAEDSRSFAHLAVA